MKTKFFLILIFPLSLFSQNLTPLSNGEVLQHTYYSISYLVEYNHAEWVFYLSSKKNVNGNAKRKDSFRPDPMLNNDFISLDDYKGSGYDRGHLLPSADMKQSDLSMSETFFLSNISPQNPNFNRGSWKNLEQIFRSWVREKDSLFITTGAVLNDSLLSIGNNLSVPEYYYKIAYCSKDTSMIAFLMPNMPLDNSLENYIVCVDSIEALTNINFYPGVDESLENSIDIVKWDLNSNIPYKANKPLKVKKVKKCKAVTKKGNKCQRNKTDGEKRCWQHLK